MGLLPWWEVFEEGWPLGRSTGTVQPGWKEVMRAREVSKAGESNVKDKNKIKNKRRMRSRISNMTEKAGREKKVVTAESKHYHNQLAKKRGKEREKRIGL